MSRVLKLLLVVLASADHASAKVFAPCDVTALVLNMTVSIKGVQQPLGCSPKDVRRIVCAASLHNFNSSYAQKTINNDTAQGLFGIPRAFYSRCRAAEKSESFQDQLRCLTSYQFVLRKSNSSLITELICDQFDLPAETLSKIISEWNVTATKNKETTWNKRVVYCQDYKTQVYVAGRSLLETYLPGVVDSSKIDTAERNVLGQKKKWCKEKSYCMNLCFNSDLTPKNPSNSNSTKVENEEIIEKEMRHLALELNWIIVALCIVIILILLLSGSLITTNLRRKCRKQKDDWSRPILTEQPNW